MNDRWYSRLSPLLLLAIGIITLATTGQTRIDDLVSYVLGSVLIGAGIVLEASHQYRHKDKDDDGPD